MWQSPFQMRKRCFHAFCICGALEMNSSGVCLCPTGCLPHYTGTLFFFFFWGTLYPSKLGMFLWKRRNKCIWIDKNLSRIQLQILKCFCQSTNPIQMALFLFHFMEKNNIPHWFILKKNAGFENNNLFIPIAKWYTAGTNLTDTRKMLRSHNNSTYPKNEHYAALLG